MKIMTKSKNWVIKWFIRGGTGSLETNAYGILQILSVCVVILLKVAHFFLLKAFNPRVCLDTYEHCLF